MAVSTDARHAWDLTVDQPAANTLRVRFGGTWRLHDRLPRIDTVAHALSDTSRPRVVVLEAGDLIAWDTGLVLFVMNVLEHCAHEGILVDRRDLPAGVNRVVALASAVAGKAKSPTPARPSWLARVGSMTLGLAESTRTSLGFVGDTTLALARLVRGRAQLRWADFLGVVHECGPRALPIVTLISFLVGLILAFMGAVQLRNFGAQIFVADLVAIAATREMGCLMTAILMAGRTGAAFAAQLGTMTVNEEIDALVTMGIRPTDFLVLPRMLGLIATMPILTIYSDVMAIVGGGFVAVSMLGLGAAEYADRTTHALTLTNVFLGILKGSVFGVLVSLSGCLRGMRAGRSAAAVGLATTSAVVTAIVLIVVAEGLFAVIFDVFRI